MIPKDCKRLAEVDFPIAVVSKHAAREKSIRHGHPSTLHLWWARRPLGACRAMLLALLLPDPCDEHCPEEFRTKSRELLLRVQGQIGAADEGLQRGLLRFIGDFANWDLASNASFLEVSQGLVKAAYPEEIPLVVDPFAGGGSIPLEALRLGCETFASDLNPVACLILKVLLEHIPRHGLELAEGLRRIGAQIKQSSEKELAEFYPLDSDGARPIAYLWVRTVRCEAPSCGAEIPLMRTLWLSKKADRKRALRYRVRRSMDESPQLELEIFAPKIDQEVPAGTVSRAKATCLCCQTILSPERVRAQLYVQRGGADVVVDEHGHRIGGARLLAVVTMKPGEQGRHYRLPTARDYEAVWKATKYLEEVSTQPLPNNLSQVPNERIIQAKVARNSPFRFHLYGCDSFGQVSTSRQKLVLSTIVRHVWDQKSTRAPLQDCLSLMVNRLANASTSLCRWHNAGEKLEGMFSRQAISMIWDFCEGSPFADATGGFNGALGWIVQVAERLAVTNLPVGHTQQADAIESPLADYSASIWFTDPPYYDAVSYADLSDFFFTWLKRTHHTPALLRDPYDIDNPLTPKKREAIQDDVRQVNGLPKDHAFFEETMAKAFAEGRRILQDDGIGCVVFAHKTTQGWEALLSGMIQGGWTITGSWPIATEMGTRLRARDSAALATSVHLVCRPRSAGAPVGDWSVVLRELPRRVGDWMERLQAEGVRGADLVFACIGPAFEVFSRYAKVETAEGHEVPLAEYLEKVWEVVGRAALEQVLGTAEVQVRNGGAGTLEEDARLTALFLWTLQSTNGNVADALPNDSAEDEDEEETSDEEEIPSLKPKGYTLVFDVVRRFAQPLGIHLPAWEHRIIETKKGVVRLFPVSDRARQLFGEGGAQLVADQLEHASSPSASTQLALFPHETSSPQPSRQARRRRTLDISDDALHTQREATTLDRLHAAMLLQSSGHTNALRTLLHAEQDRSPDFLRLANALSALYPVGSEEKRLLDAMLLVVPR